MAVIRGFQAAGIVACFEEASGGDDDDEFDIDAPRNAPAKTPIAHLDKVIWHSDFFQYEVAAGPTDCTVTHTALAVQTATFGVSYTSGVIGVPGGGGITHTVYNNVRATDILLFNHGLPYTPKVMAVLSGRMLPSGWLIQTASGGLSRHVSAFANATGVYLREVAVSGFTVLPAITQTYTIIVLRSREQDPAEPLFGGLSGELTLARGIVKSSRRYLRGTGVGDSPFALNKGPTMDISNGGVRSASGGIVVSDSSYNGGLAAPPFVQVGV